MPELPRPGVEVIQQFRATTPTVAVPPLMACLVGPCKQIVEATVTDATGASSINQEAQVVLPAFFDATVALGDPPEYTLLDGALTFAVNNHAAVVVTFDAGNYRPEDIVDKVTTALASYDETEAVAKVFGPRSARNGWRLSTIATGLGPQIEIDPDGSSAAQIVGSVDLSALVLPGAVTVGQTLELVVDGTDATVTFTGVSANVAALLAEINAVLNPLGFTATAPGPGFLLTLTADDVGLFHTIAVADPIGTASATLGFAVAGVTDTGTGSTATILSAFGLNTKDIFFGEAGYEGHEVKVPTSHFPYPRDNADEVVVETDSIRAFSKTGTRLFEALRTTSLLRKGGAVTAPDDGNGDNSTPLIQAAGQDFTSGVTVPSAASVNGAVAVNFAAIAGTTLVISDGRHQKTIQFTTNTLAGVLADINAEFNAADGIVADEFPAASGRLRLTSTKLREDLVTTAKGEDSAVVIMGGTSVLPGASNLLDPGNGVLKVGRFTGNPYKVAVGDELYVDGVFKGRVAQVAPGGNNARVKLDRQVPLTFTGTSFYFIARGLAAIPDGATDRPAPDLIVSDEGNLTIKLGLLRDTTGKIVESTPTDEPLVPGKGNLYVSYRALRLDVSNKALEPGLLKFNSSEDITALISPTNVDNPLALASYFAILNAPGTQVTALGVDELSGDLPEGTVEGYVRAFEYLESFPVYGLAPLSHSRDVADAGKTHVNFMSEPESRGERIVLWNPAKPTRKLDVLVASDTNGNTVGITGLLFDTGIANLSALLQAQDIDPTITIPVSDQLFLDIASDSKSYSISAVAGSVITIRIVFAGSENQDGFYSTTNLGTLVEEPFALKVRGASLTNTDGSPNKDGIADTYASLAAGMSDRRVWVTAPDKARAVLGGLEQLVEGYYMNAAIVGMISAQPPHQSFTNFPMSGFSGVVGSNDFFTERQMNRMAGSGVWTVVQDEINGPLTSRHALTSDMTSLETRTDSITKILDFLSFFYRRSLRNFIGRQNIDQGLLDSLGHVLEGLSDFVKGAGFVKNVLVRNLIQDEDNPDTVLLDMEVDPKYPCNKIKMTLVIL